MSSLPSPLPPDTKPGVNGIGSGLDLGLEFAPGSGLYDSDLGMLGDLPTTNLP